jgi:predicted dehydrogenase
MSNMKVVSRDNPIPLYFQVSQIIENEIKEGTYKPGDLFYCIHGVLREFAESIRENREPQISGRDNLHTLATLIATSTSSRGGRIAYPSKFFNQ